MCDRNAQSSPATVQVDATALRMFANVTGMVAEALMKQSERTEKLLNEPRTSRKRRCPEYSSWGRARVCDALVKNAGSSSSERLRVEWGSPKDPYDLLVTKESRQAPAWSVTISVVDNNLIIPKDVEHEKARALVASRRENNAQYKGHVVLSLICGEFPGKASRAVEVVAGRRILWLPLLDIEANCDVLANELDAFASGGV